LSLGLNARSGIRTREIGDGEAMLEGVAEGVDLVDFLLGEELELAGREAGGGVEARGGDEERGRVVGGGDDEALVKELAEVAGEGLAGEAGGFEGGGWEDGLGEGGEDFLAGGEEGLLALGVQVGGGSEGGFEAVEFGLELGDAGAELGGSHGFLKRRRSGGGHS